MIGDGAGVLLLEEMEHAKVLETQKSQINCRLELVQFFLSVGDFFWQRRGARIYAEFLGGSLSSDAYHYTQPHPDGK